MKNDIFVIDGIKTPLTTKEKLEVLDFLTKQLKATVYFNQSFYCQLGMYSIYIAPNCKDQLSNVCWSVGGSSYETTADEYMSKLLLRFIKQNNIDATRPE